MAASPYAACPYDGVQQHACNHTASPAPPTRPPRSPGPHLCIATSSPCHCTNHSRRSHIFTTPTATTLTPPHTTPCREANLGSETKLRELLLQDKDLGVDKANKRLVYACSGMVAADDQGRRHLLGSHQHEHDHQDHHSHGHSHGLPRKLAGLPMANSSLDGVALAGRSLQQLRSAELADPDPATLGASTSGVPLLHRWAAVGSSGQEGAAGGSSGQQWAAVGSSGQQWAAGGSRGQQGAAGGSRGQQQSQCTVPASIRHA
jgi:hypothetical protein